MKAIERCCECAYYSMRKHKCKRGAKDEGEPTARFYADCPLDEAEIMRHGRWISWEDAGNFVSSQERHECSVCHDAAHVLVNGFELLSEYCPNCGAKMDGSDDHATD